MIKFPTYFDFPMGSYKGGWNDGKSVMNILKIRGKLRQVKGHMYYEGIDFPDWSFTGSKDKCEEAFINDPQLVEDGKKLIFKLIEEFGGSFLDTAQKGVDFDDDDIKGQGDVGGEVDTSTFSPKKARIRRKVETSEDTTL